MDAVVIIGTIAGVIAAAAAILGALFAYRAWDTARTSEANALKRHTAGLQPRPRVQSIKQTNGGLFGVVQNAGGAADTVVIVLQHLGDYYALLTALPAHGTLENLLFRQLTAVPPGHPRKEGAQLMVARDVEDNWWDCMTRSQPGGKWTEWATAQLEQLGLTDLRFVEIDNGIGLRPKN
jgi:hypothetical protein